MCSIIYNSYYQFSKLKFTFKECYILELLTNKGRDLKQLSFIQYISIVWVWLIDGATIKIMTIQSLHIQSVLIQSSANKYWYLQEVIKNLLHSSFFSRTPTIYFWHLRRWTSNNYIASKYLGAEQMSDVFCF